MMPSVLPATTVQGGSGGWSSPGPRTSSARLIFVTSRFRYQALSGTSPSVFTAPAGGTAPSFRSSSPGVEKVFRRKS